MSKKENSLFTKIQAANKAKLKPVEVPEWGLTVHIKQLTVGERDSYETEAYNASKGQGIMDNPRSKFLVRVLCDEHGEPLVSPDEFMKLSQLQSRPMEKLFEAAQNYNRLTDEDIEELGKD